MVEIISDSGNVFELGDGKEVSVFESFETLLGVKPLASPLAGFENTVMIVGTSMGRGIIGSVHEFPEFLNDVWVLNPLAFRDAIQADPNGRPVGVAFQVGRIFNTVSSPRMSRMVMDYFTVLREDSAKDRDAVETYRAACAAHAVEDAGLVAAPANAISNLRGVQKP